MAGSLATWLIGCVGGSVVVVVSGGGCVSLVVKDFMWGELVFACRLPLFVDVWCGCGCGCKGGGRARVSIYHFNTP